MGTQLRLNLIFLYTSRPTQLTIFKPSKAHSSVSKEFIVKIWGTSVQGSLSNDLWDILNIQFQVREECYEHIVFFCKGALLATSLPLWWTILLKFVFICRLHIHCILSMVKSDSNHGKLIEYNSFLKLNFNHG